MKSIALCLGFLIAVLPVYARSQGVSPRAIIQMLASNQKTPRAEKLVNQLELTSSSSGRACAEFLNVTQKVLWSTESNRILAIEAYSNSCIQKFIIVLEGTPPQLRYAGTISLEERYTAPDYKIVPLLIGQKPGIMVTDNVVDSGTGVLQENTQIFAFLRGALKMVFNQPEKITLAVPSKSKCCDTQYVQTQTSAFHVVEPTQRNPTARIKEKRRISVNGRSLTEYRSYLWSKRWHTFYSVSYAPTP